MGSVTAGSPEWVMSSNIFDSACRNLYFTSTTFGVVTVVGAVCVGLATTVRVHGDAGVSTAAPSNLPWRRASKASFA
jgi:hypothetical protein